LWSHGAKSGFLLKRKDNLSCDACIGHSTILISTSLSTLRWLRMKLKAYFLWHLEIIPRLTTPVGFELGSGILVNPCVPEEAAEFLRDT